MAPLVWLITGTSAGFGWELVTQALARGDQVIATSRNASKLEGLKKLGAHTISLDVTGSETAISEAVDAAVKPFGRVDILINNAGYILEGANEEVSEEEIKAHFECNVYGVLRMLRAVLPYMRAQRSGVVANIGSIAGWKGGAAYGMYNGTKYALAGISESLKIEVEPFGIDVVCIEPGYFRTNFLTGNNRSAAKKTIPDYEAQTKELKGMLDAVNLKQPGDPEKGCRVIIEALTKTGSFAGVKTLPGRMTLGSDAAGYVQDKIKQLMEEHERFIPLTTSTNHVDVKA